MKPPLTARPQTVVCNHAPFSFSSLLTGFALTACHLVGTVSSWAPPRHPTTSTLVQTSRPTAPPLRTSPPRHWDSYGCCRNAASRRPLVPNTPHPPAAAPLRRAPKTAAKVDPRRQTQEDASCSAWTWWGNFRVWACTEWLRGECPATAKQSDRSRQPSAEGVMAVHCRNCISQQKPKEKSLRVTFEVVHSVLVFVVHREWWVCVWQREKHHLITVVWFCLHTFHCHRRAFHFL